MSNQISIRLISNGFLVAVFTKDAALPTEFFVDSKEKLLDTLIEVLNLKGEENDEQSA